MCLTPSRKLRLEWRHPKQLACRPEKFLRTVRAKEG
jgi:hypothetical protein